MCANSKQWSTSGPSQAGTSPFYTIIFVPSFIVNYTPTLTGVNISKFQICTYKSMKLCVQIVSNGLLLDPVRLEPLLSTP